MVTGLLTPEKDGLYSDWHEENIINPMRGLLFGIAWSPGLKSTPTGALVSAIASGLGFYLGAVMFVEKQIIEPLESRGSISSEPREQQFANPTPGFSSSPQFSKEQLEQVLKKFRKTKDRESAIVDLIEIAYNDMAIYTEQVFTTEKSDFSVQPYNQCKPGYTYSSTLGVCLPNA